MASNSERWPGDDPHRVESNAQHGQRSAILVSAVSHRFPRRCDYAVRSAIAVDGATQWTKVKAMNESPTGHVHVHAHGGDAQSAPAHLNLHHAVSEANRCTYGAWLHNQEIVSSARNNSDCGTRMPSALAVDRLITSSNLVGCSNRQVSTLNDQLRVPAGL